MDTIISYPGAIVVVVENEIADSDDWQAGHINIGGAALAEGEAPIVVSFLMTEKMLRGIRDRAEGRP